MKNIIALSFLLFSLIAFQAQGQTTNVIQDPLLDYYKYLKSSDYMTADGNDLSTNTITSYLSVDISGNGKKSVFITDGGAKISARHGYDWTLYSPLNSGGYTKQNVELGSRGPDYIGYINQINHYGFIVSGRSVIAYYASNNILVGTNISSDPDSFATNNSGYGLTNASSNQVTDYTLAQLAQMYGVNP